MKTKPCSKKDKLYPGLTVKVIRSHCNMNDYNVGKIGTIEREVMKDNIFRININGEFLLFGKRDLQIVSVYDMLDWSIGFPNLSGYKEI